MASCTKYGPNRGRFGLARGREGRGGGTGAWLGRMYRTIVIAGRRESMNLRPSLFPSVPRSTPPSLPFFLRLSLSASLPPSPPPPSPPPCRKPSRTKRSAMHNGSSGTNIDFDAQSTPPPSSSASREKAAAAAPTVGTSAATTNTAVPMSGIGSGAPAVGGPPLDGEEAGLDMSDFEELLDHLKTSEYLPGDFVFRYSSMPAGRVLRWSGLAPQFYEGPHLGSCTHLT